MSGEDDGFLQRWARRKARVRSGLPEAEPEAGPARVATRPGEAATGAAPAPLVPAAAVPPAAPPPVEPVEPPPPPRPTMADVATLTRSSDYSRFVGAGVDADVSNAAMKKLFSDPHFNVMDGLDTYIDDYGKPDPIPDSMLRQMTQARFLGLFDHEEPAAESPPTALPEAAAASTDGASPPEMAESMRLDDPAPIASVSPTRPDDDPDLRLQQDDAPGRSGAAPRPRA
ncbi:MAG: DUF3306 domain-containing protein [Burkholderiales bacterium]|nr:DUF3306 domain-containing protein [Burkholderiales bacterium]